MSQRRYPSELKERAVRLVFDVRGESESKRGAIARIADQLDINRETLRNWVRQAEIDDGQRAGVTTDQRAENEQLRREVAELRRANEILKAASAFFARELDRPQRR